MATYKKQLHDKDGNTIYPDVGIDLSTVVYGDGPGEAIDNIIDPNSYSTEEKWTGGYWVDGKKIYKKSIFFGSLPNTSSKTVAHGISNLKYCIDLVGVATTADYSLQLKLPWVSGGATNAVSLSVYGNNIQIQTGSDRSGMTCYVHIYYTKSNE